MECFGEMKYLEGEGGGCEGRRRRMGRIEDGEVWVNVAIKLLG